MPKTEKKTPTPKPSEAKMEPSIPSDSTTTSPTMTNNQLGSMLNRLSQQFNLLAILVIALFLFEAYTFYRVKQIEKNGVAGGGPVAQQESPLTQDKLISYAEELDLDKDKFEQCLDADATKDFISKDMEQASGLNVQGTPGFFVNGKFLAGAFPFEVFKEVIDKELDGTATGACTDYSEAVQQFCTDPANGGFNPATQEVAVGNAPVKGPQNAKVTIIEFSDFECPFCMRAFPTVEQILSTYGNDVKLAYKHLPLTNLHPNAMIAAQASVCAQQQGKFWEFHDKLFEVQTQ